MTSHICVVVAVHDRIKSVRLALHSWSLQTRKDFSIVVADDASTEDIQGLVAEYPGMIYVSTGPTPRTCAVALNVGTKAAPPETTHIWYTDGDIIFNCQAVANAYGHLAEHPARVIAGRYDWMPPMSVTTQDLEHRFPAFINCELPRYQAPGAPMAKREDHRLGRYSSNWFGHKLLDDCGAVLGANVIIPLQAWVDIGGWDEHIPGANANDCDFGWCLTDAGYHLLTCQDIMGYHQWHPRDAAFLALYQVSLPYIFRKHGKPVPERYQPFDTHNA